VSLAHPASAARVLLGGSFDPVHHGHLRAALEAAELLDCERVDLLPASMPALRSKLAASRSHRRAMLELAIHDEPRLGLDDRELTRPGTTYTVDTLTELRRELGPRTPLLFLLGADAFARLPGWQRWRELLDLAHLIVLNRPGEPLRPPADERFGAAHVAQARRLLELPAGHWSCLEVTPLAISATDLRQRCSEGRSLRYLLPERVLCYLRQHRLYQVAGNPT
jgi:nicotinate-nucleotide adenylyltransferase